ncbi:MAG TPA: type VI secretion system baseplate subunit TssK, partial [Pirellulales bacterium]
MRNFPVHWSEGLFLRPQHFQTADRYWGEQFHQGEQWDHQFYYGLRSIEWSREALGNSQFQIHSLQARMKDGTQVSLDLGQEPDRVELKDPLQQQQMLENISVDLGDAFGRFNVVRVYLAIPKLQIGQQNVAVNGEAGGRSRYIAREQQLQDESQGGNDQPVEVKVHNVKLLLSTQDMSGYELLPLCQIERASEGEAVPKVDLTYIPPILAADAWPYLHRDVIRAIYDVIGKKIEVLSAQITNRGMSLDSQEPGDAERILMLSQLNAAYTTLGVLAFALGVHPFHAYTELCRIVGQLSIFGADRRPVDLPRYDHDNLGEIFAKVRKQIELLIDAVRDYEFEQRYFVGVGLGMQVSLEPKWFNSNWEWYVGVHRGELTEQEARNLLSPGALDWKLGSSRQVEMLFQHRAEGLSLNPLARAPRALPANRDWIYYQVSRGNGAWRDVQETQTLGMRLKDALIANRNDLQ